MLRWDVGFLAAGQTTETATIQAQTCNCGNSPSHRYHSRMVSVGTALEWHLFAASRGREGEPADLVLVWRRHEVVPRRRRRRPCRCPGRRCWPQVELADQDVLLLAGNLGRNHVINSTEVVVL